jgi:hypothetical protein
MALSTLHCPTLVTLSNNKNNNNIDVLLEQQTPRRLLSRRKWAMTEEERLLLRERASWGTNSTTSRSTRHECKMEDIEESIAAIRKCKTHMYN